MRRHGFQELPKGRVFVIAPHADDEVLGVGGTLARHIARGDSVDVLILTDGARGMADGASLLELVETRRREAVAGMAQLGISSHEFWGLPEGHAPDTDMMGALALRLAMRIATAQPELVYAPWIGEQHADHYQAARLTRLGLALSGWDGLALGYEVWSPLEPHWLVDISVVWEQKLAAVGEHLSQLDHTDLCELARSNSARRAHLLSNSSPFKPLQHAEAFCELGVPEAADCELLVALTGEAA
jgi:LmbE family N-acetylglucosaminyl deacetylase